MIVKLAGTSGSGKSTVVRALFDLWNFVPELWQPGKPKVKQYKAVVHPKEFLYEVYTSVVILGDYRNPCGGMDGVSGSGNHCAMIQPYTAKRHRQTLVVLEGLIIGTTFGAIGQLGLQGQIPWLYAFMDTPLEVCLQRVAARRLERGVEEPLNPANTTQHYHQCELVQKRLQTLGYKPYLVKHNTSAKVAARKLCLEASKNE